MTDKQETIREIEHTADLGLEIEAADVAQALNLFPDQVVARYQGKGTMAEEMPHAYKDVAEVVETMELAGISKKVARLCPVGMIKG